MALKTRMFDVASFLRTDQDIALYVAEALETGDAATVAHALGAKRLAEVGIIKEETFKGPRYWLAQDILAITTNEADET